MLRQTDRPDGTHDDSPQAPTLRNLISGLRQKQTFTLSACA